MLYYYMLVLFLRDHTAAQYCCHGMQGNLLRKYLLKLRAALEAGF
jgi:hypothetical protein